MGWNPETANTKHATGEFRVYDTTSGPPELQVNRMTPVEEVYGYLLNAFHNAKRQGDNEKAERIFAASNVMRELWPEDCERWENVFNNGGHVERFQAGG